MALDEVPAGQLVQVGEAGELLYVPCVASHETIYKLHMKHQGST